MTTEIRKVEPQDFKTLVRLGREMHAESSFSGVPFSDDKAYTTLGRYVCGDDRVWYVACVDGEICGFFAGYVSPFFFSHEYVAHEILWYVVQEHRKTGLGLQLLAAFERWAKEKEVFEIRIGYSTDVDSPAFERLMQKRGYSRVGGNYRLENSP